MPSDAHEVDAVAVASAVRQVMSQMGAVHAHCFTVPQNAHVAPNHLLPRLKIEEMDRNAEQKEKTGLI